MKTVGIIGGFGPESTAKFQLEIVDLCAKQKQRHRPGILMWNTPIPLQIEEDLILKGKSADKFLPFLISAAKRLENAGSDFLVFPCNTLHIFINEIRASVKIPVLSIIDEMALSLKHKKVTKVALIATGLTVKNKLHINKLQSFGVKTILPTQKDQKQIDVIINNILNQKNIQKSEIAFKNITDKLKRRDIQNIILGCTDLQLWFNNIPEFTIHDTMKVLAQAAVREIIGGKI